jgi:hypothetical protein
MLDMKVGQKNQKTKNKTKQNLSIYSWFTTYWHLSLKYGDSEKTNSSKYGEKKILLPTKQSPPSSSLSLSLVLFAENRKLDLVVPCDDAIAELSCQQRWPRTTAAAVSSSLLLLLLLLIIIIIIMLLLLCWGDEAPTVS